MAQRHDVFARLAEGRDAVSHTQTYVSACQRLGYRHPDLTSYDRQLADCYDSEAGLDLRLLDADCAALRALADAADDALRLQRGQLAELATAWRGPGADAAAEFLRRHCDAGAELTARLRAAAAGCGVLRDELWRLVDAKVAGVLAVDERVASQRAVWLAAAHTVSAGAEDVYAADVVEKQVMPYVDNDVRGEWVSTVRAAKDGAAAAYGAATATADPGPGVVFAVPGDLGPAVAAGEPVRSAPLSVAPTPGPAAAEMAPAEPPGMPAQSASVTPSVPAGPLNDMPTDLGLPSGLGLPGGLGLPSGGLPAGGLGGPGGLGGLLPRLADALGDPGMGDVFNDPSDDRIETADHPDDTADADEPDDAEDPETESEPAAEAAAEPETDQSGEAEPADEAVPESPAEETADTEEAGASEQPPDSTADVSVKTPCEIAAEELPQVGQ